MLQTPSGWTKASPPCACGPWLACAAVNAFLFSRCRGPHDRCSENQPQPPYRAAGRHRGRRGCEPALRALVHAQGSDAPEKKEVKIGFIPLTDCASVVMASVLGFDKIRRDHRPHQRGIWAGVRDKLVNGELDFAHVLYGLVYGVHLGTAGRRRTWRC